MDAKELLKLMGFGHEQYTEHYEIDGIDRVLTTHMLTHDLIPGLFLTGKTLEDAAKHLVPVIKTLVKANGKNL